MAELVAVPLSLPAPPPPYALCAGFHTRSCCSFALALLPARASYVGPWTCQSPAPAPPTRSPSSPGWNTPGHCSYQTLTKASSEFTLRGFPMPSSSKLFIHLCLRFPSESCHLVWGYLPLKSGKRWAAVVTGATCDFPAGPPGSRKCRACQTDIYRHSPSDRTELLSQPGAYTTCIHTRLLFLSGSAPRETILCLFPGFL